MSAAETCAAVTSHCVYLVDEYYRRGILARSLEEVTHSGCTDTDIHFNEIRTGYGVERYTRLARDRLRKKSFTRSGRPHEEYTVRNLCAKLRKERGISQEFDDLLKLGFFFIGSRHILEINLVLVRYVCLCACLAE